MNVFNVYTCLYELIVASLFKNSTNKILSLPPEDISQDFTHIILHFEFVFPHPATVLIQDPLTSTFWSPEGCTARTPFAEDDELKYGVREVNRRFSKTFYTTGLQRLRQRWKSCVDNEEDLKYIYIYINFVKNVPVTYVNFIANLIIVTEKKIGDNTFVPTFLLL